MKILQRTLTWRLWRLLRQSSLDYLLYERIVADPERVPWYVLLLESAGLLFVVPIIVFTSTVYGIAWSMSIAGVIARERSRGTFDLLGVCPPGGLGASLGIMLTILYRNKTFALITSRDSLLGRLAAVGLVFFTLLREALATTDDLGYVMLIVAYAAIIATTLAVDHMQSIIFSALVGMTTPFIARGALDARLLAFTVFVTTQFCLYALVLVVALILPAWYFQIGLSGFLPSLSLPLIACLLLYGCRAGIIAVLWRTLTWQVNGDPTELA